MFVLKNIAVKRFLSILSLKMVSFLQVFTNLTLISVISSSEKFL